MTLLVSVITSTIIVELLNGHIEKSQRTATPISPSISPCWGADTGDIYLISLDEAELGLSNLVDWWQPVHTHLHVQYM